ncbi:PEP-CTERM sorting domain-containing protein, partial [Arthrospira platensis SPKY1]|nr:PEP-CTERM sorting domain-containing protein [Arthrospira platensis SPKY1]
GMMISEWGSVPTILAAFASFGVADMLINLSASGADLTQAIDLGNDVANISVTGSLSAVPEPSMMMLFAAGLFYCAQRIKRR